MIPILVMLSIFAAFLLGVLIIAWIVVTNYGDWTALYPLYALRDRLIHAVVFDGVDRDDPWFDATYENVNSILLHGRLVSGIDGWPLARVAGEILARKPHLAKEPRKFPEQDPPDQLVPILQDLVPALDEVLHTHQGMILQLTSEKAAQRRMQREAAREVRALIPRSLVVAHP